MTVYQTSGNVREQLGTEEAAEVANIDTAALAAVVANMDAIKKVAVNLGSFASLDAIVALVNAAAAAAQTARTGAETAENNAAVSASGIDAKVQLADDWARKTGGIVSGTDVSSKQSALNAAVSGADAGAAADQAAFSATAAGTSAATTDQLINGPSGQEVTPGHFTLNTYLDQILGIVSQAPVISGRYISTAGIAGVETINFAPTDFYHTIEVNRAVGHDVKLKCLQGLYTGPPPGGAQRSYAWVHVINSGLGDVTVEGPADPGGGTVITVFPPKRIAYSEGDFKVNTPGGSDIARKLPAIPVPAGSGRFVTVTTISTYWSGTGHAAPVTSGQIVGITKRNTAGDGTIGNTNPLLIELWTGTLPDGGSLTDLDVTVTPNGFMSRLVVIATVHQDCSGYENNFAAARAGTTTTVAHSLTPSVAQSANWLVAALRGNLTAPVNITGSPSAADPEDFNSNGIGQPGTTNNDEAWAVMNDGNVNAVAYTYTGTGATGGPAVMAGLTLQPRTVTVVIPPGNDGLITDQSKPFTIAPGQQGFVLAASDGTSWYGDK